MPGSVTPTARWISPAMRSVPARPRKSGGLSPAVDPAADDRRGVFGVIERSGFHDNGEGALHVESARLGISEGGKKRSVGGALANLLEAVRIHP